MTGATESQIYSAIYLRIDSLQPAWRLKKLGVDFEPGAGPWARLTFLPTPEPEFAGFGNGRYERSLRLFQIDLFYPKSEKRTDLLLERAEAVRALFWSPSCRGIAIAAGGYLLDVRREPIVGPLIEDGSSHNQVSVTVAFSTDRGPAAS